MRKELKRNDIKRLRLQPGDFVLLRFPEPFSPEHLERVARVINDTVGFRVGILQEMKPGDIQKLPYETVKRIRDSFDEAMSLCQKPKPRHTK